MLSCIMSRDIPSGMAIAAVSSRAPPTRLVTSRLLGLSKPTGLPAGRDAGLLAVPPNTLPPHLAVLSRAGLIHSVRRSRSIIYRADLHQLRAVTIFLLKDCCGGRPEICLPLIADLAPCCPPKEMIHD